MIIIIIWNGWVGRISSDVGWDERAGWRGAPMEQQLKGLCNNIDIITIYESFILPFLQGCQEGKNGPFPLNYILTQWALWQSRDWTQVFLVIVQYFNYYPTLTHALYILALYQFTCYDSLKGSLECRHFPPSYLWSTNRTALCGEKGDIC